MLRSYYDCGLNSGRSWRGQKGKEQSASKCMGTQQGRAQQLKAPNLFFRKSRGRRCHRRRRIFSNRPLPQPPWPPPWEHRRRVPQRSCYDTIGHQPGLHLRRMLLILRNRAAAVFFTFNTFLKVSRKK